MVELLLGIAFGEGQELLDKRSGRRNRCDYV